MKRLQHDAAQFNLAESKKAALRKDYDWDNKMELDEMTDNVMGDLIKNISGITYSNPEAREQLQGFMSNMHEDLFENKAFQSVFALASTGIAREENRVEQEIGLAKSSAIGYIKSLAKDEATSQLAMQAGQAVNKSRTQEDISEIYNTLVGDVAGVNNTKASSGINAAYFSDSGNNLSSFFGVEEGASNDNKIGLVMKKLGYDPMDEKYQNPVELSKVLPAVGQYLEQMAESMTSSRKLKSMGIKEAKPYAMRSIISYIGSKEKSLEFAKKDLASDKDNAEYKKRVGDLESDIQEARNAENSLFGATSLDEIIFTHGQAIGADNSSSVGETGE